VRAISAVDSALWDLLGRTCGRRLCGLLGRYRERVPACEWWRDAAGAINDLRHLCAADLPILIFTPPNPSSTWRATSSSRWARFEEPVLPAQIEATARIAEKLVTPIATGEIEAGRGAFHAIVDAGAASILQAD
jgi:L-alanine-DL-glutamate epimerase-like enolase superfamily enzyme